MRHNTNGGRRRPADAKLILAQVKEEFEKKKNELGAGPAAKQLRVCPASFYNYLKGKTLPDMEVLRRASEEWKIKWKHMDFSEIMPRQKIRNFEQLNLEWLKAVSEEDVEIVQVGPAGAGSLRIALRIRFSTD